MKKIAFGKRLMAMLLVLTMVLSMAACGAPRKQEEQTQLPPVSNEEELSREDMELIVELLGDGEDPSRLTDEELKALVDRLVGDQDPAQLVQLGNQEQEETPTLDMDPDAYDENGAMVKPFDQVYPEVVEKEEVKFSGESILIKLSDNTLTDGLKAAGIGALEEIVPLNDCAWYEALLTEGTEAKAALASVRALKEVMLAEYNYEVKTAALDDYKHFDDKTDEEFKKNGHNKDQWHQHHCGIPDGYEEMETEGGDPSVIVAVIDSGVDYEHEDLKDNMWFNKGEIPDNGVDDDKNGYVDDYYGVDIVAGKGSGNDTNGHGTHVAGIIAGRNNNTGIVGIAYSVKIMSVKAAAHNGTLLQSDIAKAVLYAYEHGAEVINMSFGGAACSIAVQDALATAYTRCVMVASAGNNGLPNELAKSTLPPLPNYPAALTYVLGVMSVDETGRESAFTNWDVKAFNGVEYEVCAPGENIMSTLPGNRYGYLSGTSMAAPIVSAFAAILRSEFSDRDMYPTKFIYGQLASTSEMHAECLDPELHGPHNLPQIVDLNAALTKLPKPEVSYQDYRLFDDPKYSEKNNGDGVIDAGETVALGLTLRNRWGMSKNTLVTVDTKSSASGMEDPYITIHNPTVNYDSVGTYSTQDCGKVYTDELWTGWEDPFLITVSEDCPNDYRFTLNVTVTCENALDEEDTTVYKSEDQVSENVRAGYILPSIIEEDMVLTSDRLYIIPNATVIQEGVTVRVEPGTHIQFWTDDPNDTYADTYIAFLLVNGNFLVEGTKEDPVYIYPSGLMDHYGVEIGSSSTGYVSMKYADVTNFMYPGYDGHTGTGNNVDLAEHCTFRNNYSGALLYRDVSGGNVQQSATSSAYIGILNAKDCVFYKLGMDVLDLYGEFERCVFAQCGIQYHQGYQGTIPIGNGYTSIYSYYTDCVFLGNSLVDQTNPDAHLNSTMWTGASTVSEIDQIFYRPETGTTYVTACDENGLFREFLADAFGLERVSYAVIETPEEGIWLCQQMNKGVSNKIYNYDLGLLYDEAAGKLVWSDGTAIAPELDPNGDNDRIENAGIKGCFQFFCTPVYYEGLAYVSHYEYKSCLSASDKSVPVYGLYEIPGRILPTDITFREYTVDMDLDTTYQIAPQNTPVQLPATEFLYESADESVLKVSETGLVTPVGLGTADVWVWSLDKAVRNKLTVTVREYVPLTGMEFPVNHLKLEMGTSADAACLLTPADTTRHNVTYTSSDPNVVQVDNGILTAVGQGSATVTATCEGLTDTMQVTTWIRATELTYKKYRIDRTMESCDTSLPELEVVPANADLDLVWKADDEGIVSVVDGKLQLKHAGDTYLRVTDKNSGKTVSFYIVVTSCPPVIQKDLIAAQPGSEAELPQVTLGEGPDAQAVWSILDPAVAQLADGKVQFLSAGITTLRATDPRSGLYDEIALYVTEGETPRVKKLWTNSYYGDPRNLAQMENGDVYYWDKNQRKPVLLCENAKLAGIAEGIHYSLVTQDNEVLAYEDAKLYQPYNTTTYLTLPESIEPVAVLGAYLRYNNYGAENASGSLRILDNTGKVYAIGSNTNGYLGTGSYDFVTELTQVQLNETVVQLAGNHETTYYLTEKGNLYVSGDPSLQAASPVMVARDVTWLDDSGKYYVSANRLYKFANGTSQDRGYDFTGWKLLDMCNYYNSSWSGIMEKDGKVYEIGGVTNPTYYYKMQAQQPVVGGGIGENYNYATYVLTEDGFLLGRGYAENMMDMSSNNTTGSGRGLFLPVVRPAEQLTLLETNLEGELLTQDTLDLTFNKNLMDVAVSVVENGTTMTVDSVIEGNVLKVKPSIGLDDGAHYTVVVSATGTEGIGSTVLAEDLQVTFTYEEPKEETIPQEDEPVTTLPDRTPEDQTVYESITDETVLRYWTLERLKTARTAWDKEHQLSAFFRGNAILNPISTDDVVEHWLRVQAPTVSVGQYKELPMGGNWWGSTNEKAIGLQMIDYTDFINYYRLMYAPFLTEAPENTFPFVTSVKLFNKYGEEVTTVGNETVTFQVKFNRDMDTSIPLLVRFGSAFPYGDYEIEGSYVDERTWEGTYTLKTTIENGNQLFTISNGCSATDDLELQLDRGRFGFVIDTTAAQALIMQGSATDTGIELKWTQDDFDTLMGYNVYRSDKEDGLYTRLNKTVIPADTMTFFDDTVEPGKVYYYNFTVVQTDLTESEPSGKIVIMSKDTMAPDIYHSPAANAFTGENLVLSATVTDNLNIVYANLYYRVAGTDVWNTVRMNNLNDKYSAIVPAAYVTISGVEYYIEAFDGVSYTYKGSAEAPYLVAVQESVDANALGDVDGDGAITNLDALLLLYAINDKYNLTAEEFARADLNGDGELWAAEALRILQYVSGTVGSVKM